MKKYLFIMCILFICIGILPFRNLKTKSVVTYNGDYLMVSVDGVEVNQLPTSGNYYLSDYTCKSKNTKIVWNQDSYSLTISNGNKKAGVSCYLTFESHPKLSSMKKGSYVQYGNEQIYRIAYVKDGISYLVSDKAVGSYCTDSSGNLLTSCIDNVSVNSVSQHLINLDNVAIGYCDVNYVYHGVCDSSTVHNINDVDFQLILGSKNNIGSCYHIQGGNCGYYNDLLDNSQSYWYNVSYNSLSEMILYWDGNLRKINGSTSKASYGIRPIIKMNEGVIVISGDGTLQHPYQIANNGFIIQNIDKEHDKMTLKMLGYQVSTMCINLNSTVCTNYIPYQDVYELDLSKARDGDNVLYVYYRDDNSELITNTHRNFSLS